MPSNTTSVSEKGTLTYSQSVSVVTQPVEQILMDKKMLNSIKRRIIIADKVFDFREIVFIYCGTVFGGWVSFFAVDDKIKDEYKKWLILLSVVAFVFSVILVYMKKHKKEFTNTILTDLEEIEDSPRY